MWGLGFIRVYRAEAQRPKTITDKDRRQNSQASLQLTAMGTPTWSLAAHLSRAEARLRFSGSRIQGLGFRA